MQAMNKFIIILTTISSLLYWPMAIAATQNKSSVPTQEVRQFVTVLAQIKRHYIKEVSDHELFANAMRGMVSRLDPHSSYLDKKDLKELHTATTGQFAGIGIEMAVNEDGDMYRTWQRTAKFVSYLLDKYRLT